MEKKNHYFNLDKIFIIFLILHVSLWSLLPLIREILPIDAMECVYWGSLLDFGTNKHPPLAAWLAYFVHYIFKSDFSVYLLGQISILFGFIYMFKLSCLFFDKTKAVLSVMIMEACFAYTYMGIYDGFNPNFLLLAFLPAITYYFYRATHEAGIKYWILLGIFVGLSFLAKYQTLMLFIPLFLYLLIADTGRKAFKNKGFYFASGIAFLLVLPHIIWLYNYDFFSFNYFLQCEDKYATFYHGPLKYIYSPFIFLFNQFIAVLGTLFIYFSALLFSKEKLSENENSNDTKIFLICAGIMPVILQSLHGLNGNYMIPQWGYSLLFLSGVLLFYFFPFKLSDKVIKYIISWVFGAMFITAVVLSIVFLTEKNFANRFPVAQVTKTLTNLYESETGQDLKYLGGFIELTIPLHLYNNKYNVIIDTYGSKSPWLDNQDLRNSGVLVIGRNPAYMEGYIEASAPGLAQKPEVKEFYFTVKSAVGKEREYKMYYAIVPQGAKYKD